MGMGPRPKLRANRGAKFWMYGLHSGLYLLTAHNFSLQHKTAPYSTTICVLVFVLVSMSMVLVSMCIVLVCLWVRQRPHLPLVLDQPALQRQISTVHLFDICFSFLPSFCDGREEFSGPAVQGVGVELEGTTRR